MIHFFFTTKCTFSRQSIFYSLFLNEDGRIRGKRLSCIIDFDDIQLCLRQFCLNLNICKVTTIFFKSWPKKIRKTVPMQLTKTNFQNSPIFIKKKWRKPIVGKRCIFVGKKN